MAEAVGIAYRHHRQKRHKISIAGEMLPQTMDVVTTRAEPLGIELGNGSVDAETAALIVPWPDSRGVFVDHKNLIAQARELDVLVVFVADPLALTISASPASLGADIAVGSMQRFGVPMGYGGPHAAYCAVAEKLTRLMPGRIGSAQSVDAQ